MGLKESGLRGSLRNASSVTPAFFDVTITNTNEPITEGDTLNVDYSVSNTGDKKDIQDIWLEIDSVEEDRDSNIEIFGGGSATGTLNWVTADGEAGSYTATVFSDDSSDSVSVQVESAIPDSGVLRYNFEQDVTDAWNSNDGTNNGGTFTTTAKWDSYALSLDGTDDYVEYPTVNETGPSTAWSVSMFLNLNTLPSEEEYFLWHPRGEFDYVLLVTNGYAATQGEVVLLSYDGGSNYLQSGYILSTGSYVQVGVSHDGAGNYSLVAEGNIQNTGALPDPNSVSNTNKIGAQPSLSQKYTDGLIDRFDIYNKELTSTEWSNLASTGNIRG